MNNIKASLQNSSLLNNDCLGVVLAGGKSSRMGTNKALLTRGTAGLNSNTNNSETMLSYSKNLLKNIGIEKVIVSGDIASESNCVSDKFAELGPMGGIFSVLKKFQPKSLLILPVDLPLMTKQTLAELKIKGELSQKACFFNDHFLPLYLPNNAFVEQFFTRHFAQYLSESETVSTQENGKGKNGPSIRSMLAQVPHQALTLKSPQCLFNSNTPQDWQKAQQRFCL